MKAIIKALCSIMIGWRLISLLNYQIPCNIGQNCRSLLSEAVITDALCSLSYKQGKYVMTRRKASKLLITSHTVAKLYKASRNDVYTL